MAANGNVVLKQKALRQQTRRRKREVRHSGERPRRNFQRVDAQRTARVLVHGAEIRGEARFAKLRLHPRAICLRQVRHPVCSNPNHMIFLF
ncbi:hypothetical protein SDC9_119710 [bioreactor metagenome]|uniref:Uncharacterized protein n=1 Tax=bioreactor metagenome TaxID=1076179 RepID=A0A645C9I7_9ZZZZ